MKKTAALLLFAAILLSSCKKNDGPTTITGKVLQRGTDEPVAGAWVHFVWMTFSTYNEILHPIDSVQTDQNGNYHIAADTEKKDLLVYGKAHHYFSNYDTEHLMPNVSRGSSPNIDISLIPYAWVKMNFIKTGEGHAVSTNRMIGADDLNLGFQVYKDTALVSRAYGNQSLHISCYYYESGVHVKNESIPVQTIGLDTVSVDIYF